VAALANLVESIGPAGPGTSSPSIPLHPDIVRRLHAEPGYLGAFLRSRARARGTRVLVFVDQFEELYTLVPDARDRLTFTACLAGVADDASSPLRAIVSMRSDFLDRAAEDRSFMEQLTGALMFLGAPSRVGLKTVLIQPAEMAGYRFEDDDMVEAMLDALQASAAALPLLQFTAARLWDARDRERRLLTRQSYEDIGGMAGALASHADDILAGLALPDQRLVRAIFERLVTPERTRAISSVEDLCQISRDPDSARALVDRLVRARLLAVHDQTDRQSDRQTDSDGPRERGDEPMVEPMVEIVHESLIEGWPTLRRWLDEDDERAAFLAQLRVAAKQWEARGRPPGLLWRGEAMIEARHWHPRLQGELSGRERAYLDAVVSLANRSIRRRRMLFAMIFAVLVTMVGAASVALVWIRTAEHEAKQEARRARTSQSLALKEAARARAAEDSLAATVKELRQANGRTAVAHEELQQREEQLRRVNEQIRESLASTEQAQKQAEAESARARQAAVEAQNARARADELAESERRARKEREAALRESEKYAKELEAKLKDLGISTRMR
jgi:hypothetical protein